MIYRKISIEIEAFQYGVDKEPDWFLKTVEVGDVLREYCSQGDFIIKDGGTAYEMENKIFLDEYELIKAEE